MQRKYCVSYQEGGVKKRFKTSSGDEFLKELLVLETKNVPYQYEIRG